jgi:peptidoglycan hydrolase-like protein with peptidoglycan-binding domain
MAKDERTGQEQEVVDAAPPEGSVGPRTDAQVLADQQMMTDTTPPGILPDQRQGTSSRFNAGRDTFNAGKRDRANITRLVYWGRKDPWGDVQEDQVRGEHIDVTVPDEKSNARRVETLRSRIPQGNLTEDDKKQAGLDQMTGDALHTRGQHYHFEQGQATDVYNEDVEFLKNHKTYHIAEAKTGQPAAAQ